MKKYIYISIIITLTGGAGYFIYTKSYSKNSVATPPVIDLNNLASTSLPVTPNIAEKIAKEPENIPEGYIKYTNVKYSFSLYRSPQGKITEYDQGQGAMIITLENEQKVRGMQIFVVPYWEKEITNERFLADVKSGVRENVEKTYVDGVEAVTFTSVDENLGATREVWVIRGGYLYEITTFRGVGNWFVPIIQTWKWR